MPVYIRDKIKILFIHVPKTGGTSVEHFFIRNGFGQFHYCTGKDPIFHSLNCSYQHFHGEMLKNIFKLTSFDLIFMVVRNPLDRIISEYKWRKPKEDFDSWIQKVLNGYKRNPYILDDHIRPQHEFEVEGTKIFKFEEGLENIVNFLGNFFRISFNYRYMPKANISNIETPISISDNSIESIYEFYKEDFFALRI